MVPVAYTDLETERHELLATYAMDDYIHSTPG